MRSIPIALVIAVFGLPAAAAPARAQAPVAVVEDVTGNPPGVEFMDYVTPGKVIRLGAKEKLIIGYLKSCWREIITGGTVTVGTEQSDVQGGAVERTRPACEAGKMQLTAELASKAGGMVFRDMPRTGGKSVPKPQFALYGRSPLVELQNGSKLVIDRLDKPGEHIEVTGGSQPEMRGPYYDFAATDVALAPNGIYRASVGTVQLVFQIDSEAQSGRTPIAGRLLRMQRAK